MIDFACKRFDLREIIKCSLGLTRAECKVFEYFLEHSGERLSSGDLANKVGLDVSTIQKAVKKLHQSGVIDRFQVNLDSGGYVFEYELKTKNEVRTVIKKVIRKWSSTVEKRIDEW